MSEKVSQAIVQKLIDERDGLKRLLRKFANHRQDCHCFICRSLTPDEREILERFHASE